MSKLLLVGFVSLGMAACEDFPKDPQETTENVAAGGKMRTGVIAGEDKKASALAEDIAGVVGAEPVLEIGTAEILMPKLKSGELDIVIGRFAKSSPWKRRVAFTKPAVTAQNLNQKREQPVLRAVVARGENRWLMRVEQAMASK